MVPGWQVEFRVAAEAPPEPDYALFIPGQPVSGMEPIQIVFLNSTGEQAYVLDIPHLERMTEGGAWEEVPYREQAGFCGTPSSMPPNGRIWSEDPAALWGALEPGLYRLRYGTGPPSPLRRPPPAYPRSRLPCRPPRPAPGTGR